MIALDGVKIINKKLHLNNYKLTNTLFAGIVRAIDTKKNVIYLMTPLNQNEIDRVKCLMVGSVKLPSYIYTTVGDVNGTNPYLSFGFESIFSQIPKRAYIPKK